MKTENNESIKSIITRLAEACDCTYRDVTGRSRESQICAVRQVIWKVLREQGMKLVHIAVLFDRGHPAIINGIKHVDDLISCHDRQITQIYEKCSKLP